MKTPQTTQELASLKLTATVLSSETHEIAAQAYYLMHATSSTAYLNVSSLRRQIGRMRNAIVDMEASLAIVERDMGAEHKAEAA